MGILTGNKNIRSFQEVKLCRNLETLDLSGCTNIKGDLDLTRATKLESVNVSGTVLDMQLPPTSTLTSLSYGAPTRVLFPENNSIHTSNFSIDSVHNLNEISISDTRDHKSFTTLLNLIDRKVEIDSKSDTIDIKCPIDFTKLQNIFNILLSEAYLDKHLYFSIISDPNLIAVEIFNDNLYINLDKISRTLYLIVTVLVYCSDDNTKGLIDIYVNMYTYINSKVSDGAIIVSTAITTYPDITDKLDRYHSLCEVVAQYPNLINVIRQDTSDFAYSKAIQSKPSYMGTINNNSTLVNILSQYPDIIVELVKYPILITSKLADYPSVAKSLTKLTTNPYITLVPIAEYSTNLRLSSGLTLTTSDLTIEYYVDIRFQLTNLTRWIGIYPYSNAYFGVDSSNNYRFSGGKCGMRDKLYYKAGGSDKKYYFLKNDGRVYSGNLGTTYTNANPAVFGINNGTYGSWENAQLYSMRLYKDNTLLRFFVPYFDTNTDTSYLLDLVYGVKYAPGLTGITGAGKLKYMES